MKEIIIMIWIMQKKMKISERGQASGVRVPKRERTRTNQRRRRRRRKQVEIGNRKREGTGGPGHV